jgi:hypothetical protein
MFKTKKATINLDGFTYIQGLTLITNLATSPSFNDLQFGINEAATKLTVKGPRESVNSFLEVAKTFQ